MTLGVGGARRDAGVSVAEVNLTLIWDVVSQIKVGRRGQAYVIDERGRLIAHPDISLVLSNSDVSHLAQVRAAKATALDPAPEQDPVEGIQGGRVLAAYASVPSLGWLVFVELPVAEAYVPIYASMQRSGTLLAVALVLALLASVLLARRMVGPIQALRLGAERIGSGDLSQRLSIRTGDELEALGQQFNSMAARLEESYATLERKVDERTHQLQLANLAKARFLAVATHDLRQPLHVLGLFVAQLRARLEATERNYLIERIDAAVGAINELFNALLDISKLDAGVVAPDISEFPVNTLLNRIETTFASAAREKGLRLRIVPSRAWVRSDFIMLERVLINLSVSVRMAAARETAPVPSLLLGAIADALRGKLIVIIDDDRLVLDGMRGLLQSWGCEVVAAQSDDAALASLANHDRRPDLIISDNQLADGRTGYAAIEHLRSALGAPIPAFLISGDTAPERLREASAGGYLLLHKPISPAALRATLNHLLGDRRREPGRQVQEASPPGPPMTTSLVSSPSQAPPLR